MTTDNKSLPPLPAPDYGVGGWLGRAFDADAYTAEQMQAYGDACAAHALEAPEPTDHCEDVLDMAKAEPARPLTGPVVAWHYKYSTATNKNVWSVGFNVPKIATEWHPLFRKQVGAVIPLAEPVTDDEIDAALNELDLLNEFTTMAEMRRALEGFAAGRATAPPVPEAVTALDVCTDGYNCRRCKTHPNHRGDIPHAGIPAGNSFGAQPAPVPSEVAAGRATGVEPAVCGNCIGTGTEHGVYSTRPCSFCNKPAAGQAPAVAEPTAKDLHDEIMNLPCGPAYAPLRINQRLAYKIGHRDARHAAAELAASKGETQ